MSEKNENINDDSIKDRVEEILDDAIEEVEKENSPESEADDGEMTEEQKLREEVGKEKDRFLRLFAEFENYKKRTSKERIDLYKTAGQDVMSSLLPVLDDFDRAMNEINKSGDKNLAKGVELIHNKLKDSLRSKGLEVLEIKPGDSFDPDIHDAVTQIPAPSDKLKGKIVDVVEKGYTLNDKIIRFPKVVTGK